MCVNVHNPFVVPLPTTRKRWTILTDPHIHKKAQESWELMGHRRLLQFEGRPVDCDLLVRVILERSMGVDVQIIEKSYERLDGREARQQRRAWWQVSSLLGWAYFKTCVETILIRPPFWWPLYSSSFLSSL